MFTPLFPSFLGSPEAVTLIKMIVFDVSLISQSFAAVALTATHFRVHLGASVGQWSQLALAKFRIRITTAKSGPCEGSRLMLCLHRGQVDTPHSYQQYHIPSHWLIGVRAFYIYKYGKMRYFNQIRPKYIKYNIKYNKIYKIIILYIYIYYRYLILNNWYFMIFYIL